jgi:hypothetical protein
VSSSRTVLVPPGRVVRWFENFAARHGKPVYDVRAGSLHAAAPDGATARAELPLARAYDGPPDPAALAGATTAPPRWGVLLVRRGGFAVAAVEDGGVVDSKVGQRHVQGRTKAGGQSQQRFARRRDNQARQAYEAAAEHASRILRDVQLVVGGGDRTAVDAVLEDPRLRRLVRVEPWLAVPDPRRAVLEQAVLDGSSVRIHVTDPPAPTPTSDASR